MWTAPIERSVLPNNPTHILYNPRLLDYKLENYVENILVPHWAGDDHEATSHQPEWRASKLI